MGKTYDAIEGPIREFIEAQHLFFVATAPAGPSGHVNLSPKGGQDTLRVIDAHTLAYLDFVGSGAETIAHLRENGRIVIMWCALDGYPKIVRVHGRGEVVEPTAPVFEELRSRFPTHAPGVRSIIVVHAERISDSCGFGVPLYRYEGERPQLGEWATKKGPEGLQEYQVRKNVKSIDGLPAATWVDKP